MCGDWNRAFRQDFKEPEPLPAEKAMRVSECDLEPSEGFKTWKNVFLHGRLIGMVRVRMGGWCECKIRPEDDALHCGIATTLNSRDSQYSLAVLTLRELVGV